MSFRLPARRAVRALLERQRAEVRAKGDERPPCLYPAQKRKNLVLALGDHAKLVAAGNPDSTVALDLVISARGYAGTTDVDANYPAVSAFDAMIDRMKKGKATDAQVAAFLATIAAALAPARPIPVVPQRMTRRDGEGPS